MAVKRNGTAAKYLILHNGVKLKKGYHNGTKEIWSAGSTVTYIVDTDKSYTEEVDYGATCLAPTTFTPSKSGWTFIGWREDTTAASGVLNSKTMESDPITLYAVYKKTITLTVVVESASTAHTGTAYCNGSGSIKNPTFTVDDPAKDDYIFVGWSNTVDGEIAYEGINNLTLDSDKTVYALFTESVTIYSYSGSIQEYLAPVDGTYKFELWGAQGGGIKSFIGGGKGGYSQGMVQLTRGQKIYIVIGGQGANAESAYIDTPGGYNGGGKGHSEKQSSGRWPLGGGGGGATHIATVSGLLSELSTNKESVLMVAGGGGGAAARDGWNDDGSGAGMQVTGGTGGGTTGGDGIGSDDQKGLGGTQTAGGAAILGVATTAGTFGKGGCGDNTYALFSGGGSGYYGGSAGYSYNSAGGGSGYVGGVTDGTTENGVQSGNGRAVITHVA